MLKYGLPLQDMIEIAKTVARTEEGELLVVRRAEHDSNPGKWEVPGGGVEDERPFEAALRELKEETGLTPDIMTRKGSGDLEVNERQFRFHVFLAETEKTEIKLSEEHSSYRWIQVDQHSELETVDGFEKDLKIAGVKETNKESENRK